jgi:TorA maturation chaperone TorD
MDGTGAIGRAVTSPDQLPEEELLRAQSYRLLAQLLAAPPDTALLEALAALSGGEAPFGQALDALAQAAAETTSAAAAEEYHDLFIGVGRGELVPYGSYYLTGFINERPLVALRGALEALGIARAPEVTEPEDHIAALCEVMAGLITSAFGAPHSIAEQRTFYDAHLAPWAPRFFEDLERAEAARLYAAVARVGRLFLDIESTAFAMA